MQKDLLPECHEPEDNDTAFNVNDYWKFSLFMFDKGEIIEREKVI